MLRDQSRRPHFLIPQFRMFMDVATPADHFLLDRIRFLPDRPFQRESVGMASSLLNTHRAEERHAKGEERTTPHRAAPGFAKLFTAPISTLRTHLNPSV